ncbi:MAG: YciI family protein [Clostridiales bacterium]|nr:YciI family protein [Clostridiales bacterium]
MQYIIRAYDGAGMLEKRLAVRPRHLENMARVNGRVLCAGSLLDENGKMKGSVLVMDFAECGDLQKYLDSEPYITEHVWEKVEVEPINVVILNGQKIGR